MTDSSLDKPFRQISWMTSEGDKSSSGVISQRINELNALLGPLNILETEPIPTENLPLSWDERAFSVHMNGRDWLTEPEFTSRLAMLVKDPVVIRRYAVDCSVVQRSKDGTKYWLVEE
ncbi:DUF2087 domain-containing protein [Alloscardovia venturai]|uniref:DUF2087 domain-containing protein n=1 Tax=Alloscardovia venturai TaxID=1769421 RepID=A0ABW2Y9J5_9BIFI